MPKSLKWRRLRGVCEFQNKVRSQLSHCQVPAGFYTTVKLCVCGRLAHWAHSFAIVRSVAPCHEICLVFSIFFLIFYEISLGVQLQDLQGGGCRRNASLNEADHTKGGRQESVVLKLPPKPQAVEQPKKERKKDQISSFVPAPGITGLVLVINSLAEKRPTSEFSFPHFVSV